MQLRDAVMSAWGMGAAFAYIQAIKCRGPIGRIKTLGTVCRYGFLCGRMCSRGCKKVDVNDLVDKWIKATVGMCLAHDKDQFDFHDARADELLGPLLTAPISQVREFYKALVEKMESTKEVPFIVIMSFKAWGEIVVDKAVDDAGIKRLKRKLAGEIADLVELPIRDQLPEAIKRALMWRDPETLKEVKAVFAGGAKPKIVGRQSCLFLEGKKGGKKVSVML